MKPNIRHAFTVLASAALLVSCKDDPSGVPTVPENELVFVRQASTAPALAATEVAFWAVAGDGRDIRVRYANGENCLEFKVPGNGLLRRPDGTRFQRGDSVRITVRVTDPRRFSFEFEPSGLRFDPDHPAELRMRYRYADPDLNGDGQVDSADDRVDFALWRQEAAGQPWSRLGTVKDADLEEVRADITGFSKYAMASD
ncbi:MAG TPA: hypothetical protein VF625_09845 [Longimicrobium sp.]|jgi:hypothetical protein